MMRAVRSLVLVLGALAIVVPSAVSAPMPDLTVTDAGIFDPTVLAGARTKVAVGVRNAGGGGAAATTVTFFLSTDARIGSDRALAGSATVARLGARGTGTASGSLTIPRGLRPGVYRVFACVDERGAVAEANDRNNCARTPEPVTVERPVKAVKVAPVALDGGSGGEGTISRDGGRVFHIGADGTYYALVVPAGALPYDTRVTIRPLASIGGLPFAGGMTAGVQLEPSGISFAKAATLVVSGPRITPGPEDSVYAWGGVGTGFHLAPAYRTPPAGMGEGLDPAHTVYIPVQHFSGTGIGPVTDRESAVQQRKGAAEARDRIAQDVQDALKHDKDTAPLFERYLDEVLIPEASAASFSDAMYEAAIQDFISWQRQRILLGFEEEPSNPRLKAKLAQLERLLDLAWKELVKRADERCQQGGFEVIARIIPLERQRELLGLGGTPNEFSKITERCWRFELQVTSQVKRDVDGGVTGLSGKEHMTWKLEGKVPIKLKGEVDGLEIALGRLEGAGPFVYTVREYDGAGHIDFSPFFAGDCQQSWAGTTTPGQITLHDGSIIARYKGPIEPFFTIDLGEPREKIHETCQGTAFGQPNNTTEDRDEDHFMRWWRSAHASWSASSRNPGAADDPGPWTVKLKAGRHPNIGTLQFDHAWAPDQGASLTETWTLVHKPLRTAR